MRSAVGDAKLTYVGYSYGTQLGQTYANMFPNRFRALVIDGVLDPVAWTTGRRGEAATCRSRRGSAATRERWTRSASSSACATRAVTPARSRRCGRAVRRARGRSATSPLLLTDPETGEVFEYNYSILIADSLGAMYDSFSGPTSRFCSRRSRRLSEPAAGDALAEFRRRLRGCWTHRSRSSPIPECPRGVPRCCLQRLRQPVQLPRVVGGRDRVGPGSGTSAGSGRGRRASAPSGRAPTGIDTWAHGPRRTDSPS